MPRSENYSTDSVQSFKLNFREHLPITQIHIRDNAPFPKKKRYATLAPDLLEYWKTLVPLGDVATEYLRSRGCFIPPADGDVRYASNVVGLGFDWHQGPAFVSLITEAVTGEPISLHITWVKADGTKPYDRRVIADHTTSNGVIRLCPLLDGDRTLAVAEGVETALTLAHRFTPVWATLNSGNLTNFPLIENVEHLIIAVDHDGNQVGQKAADECATRYAKAGRRVSLVMSPRLGEDLNDFIRGCK